MSLAVNREPTAQTTPARPWRECANGAKENGFAPQRTPRGTEESVSLAKSAKGAKFKPPCALRGSVRDGLFGSGFEPQRAQSYTEGRVLTQWAKRGNHLSQRHGAAEIDPPVVPLCLRENRLPAPLGVLASWRENRLSGSGFEPQRAQRGTELQIRVYSSRPRRESGSVVDSSGGSDRTHLDDRNATMPGLTFLG